jgi:hypothetical protein
MKQEEDSMSSSPILKDKHAVIFGAGGPSSPMDAAELYKVEEAAPCLGDGRI